MNIDEKYGLCQYEKERIKQSLSLVYLILINWFKGTVRVISSDPKQAKIAMSDLPSYPYKFYLIENKLDGKV